jgi:hypothetical protein
MTLVDLDERRQSASTGPDAARAYAAAELADGRRVTGADLARRFEISPRTGQRIVAGLTDGGRPANGHGRSTAKRSSGRSGQRGQPATWPATVPVNGHAGDGRPPVQRSSELAGQSAITSGRPDDRPSAKAQLTVAGQAATSSANGHGGRPPATAGHGQVVADGHPAIDAGRPSGQRPATNGHGHSGHLATGQVAANGSGRPPATEPGRLARWVASVTGAQLDRWIGYAVGIIAAVASYGHMREVCLMAGETPWIARLVPLTVDGLALTAWRQGKRGRCWLAFGVAASVAGNVLTDYPEIVEQYSWAIKAIPAVAIVGIHQLLHNGKSREGAGGHDD